MPLADTATWIAVGFAIGAAFLALAASGALLTHVVRRGRENGREPAPGGRPELRAVPDEASLALVDARGEARRSRRLAEIAATIDLDAVLERTVTAATDTAGVDAAMAVVRQDDGEPLVVTFGMTAREASRQPVTTSPSGGAPGRAHQLPVRAGGR